MKINREMYSKARALKELKIPKKKRAEFIEQSTGLTSIVFGLRNTMNEAIEYSKKESLEGRNAIEYIEAAMGLHEIDIENALFDYDIPF